MSPTAFIITDDVATEMNVMNLKKKKSNLVPNIRRCCLKISCCAKPGETKSQSDIYVDEFVCFSAAVRIC